MKIFVRLTALFAFALFLCIYKMPSQWLEYENRMAKDFSFTDASFCDRIPFRTSLLKLNKFITLFSGQREFSGAFLGKNGYIFSNEKVDVKILDKNLAAAKAFEKIVNFKTNFVIIGSKTDVLTSLYPTFFYSDREILWQRQGYNTKVMPYLIHKAAEGKNIYYKGDHHLTSLGSFYLYQAIAEDLGIKPYDASDFSVSVVKNDFLGSDAKKFMSATVDKIFLFRYSDDGKFITENHDTAQSYSGLYDYKKLASNDPYGIFPVADSSHATISTPQKREKLLLVCDSYGDSLCPFLVRHYDLEIIDPRYYNGSVKELLKNDNYISVLLCFGMDTLAKNEILYKLTM